MATRRSINEHPVHWIAHLAKWSSQDIRRYAPSPSAWKGASSTLLKTLFTQLRQPTLASTDRQEAVITALPLDIQIQVLRAAAREARADWLTVVLAQPAVGAHERAHDSFALTLAARQGDGACLRQLLDHLDPTALNSLALHEACAAGQEAAVALLAPRAEVRAVNHRAVISAMRHPHAAVLLPHLLPHADLDALIEDLRNEMIPTGSYRPALSWTVVDQLAAYATTVQRQRWLERWGEAALPACATHERALSRAQALAQRPSSGTRMRRRS